MGSFIKIDRKIVKWEWWSDINTFRLFFYMLITAYWKDGNYKGNPIPRGSFPSSVSELSKETNLTENEIRTALKHLKSTGEITSKSTNKFTVFSVKNYDLYQSDNKQNCEQITNQNTNEVQTDNEQLTNKSQTNNEQLTNSILKENKNEKNVKELKNEKNTTIPQGDSTAQKKKTTEEKHKYGEYQHVLLTDRQFERLVNDYGEFEVQSAIKFLDEYIQMKGYKAKDHNLALRKWVFKAVEEEKSKNTPQQSRGNDYWAGI